MTPNIWAPPSFIPDLEGGPSGRRPTQTHAPAGQQRRNGRAQEVCEAFAGGGAPTLRPRQKCKDLGRAANPRPHRQHQPLWLLAPPYQNRTNAPAPPPTKPDCAPPHLCAWLRVGSFPCHKVVERSACADFCAASLVVQQARDGVQVGLGCEVRRRLQGRQALSKRHKSRESLHSSYESRLQKIECGTCAFRKSMSKKIIHFGPC